MLGELAVEDAYAAVSFPYAIGSNGEENFGRISVFKICGCTSDDIIHHATFTGEREAKNIGKTLHLRKFNLPNKGIQTYELFYDNWMPLES